MEIKAPIIIKTPLAQQVAALTDLKAENIMVTQGPDRIEVKLGKLTKEGFKVTGDVPADKQPDITTWANKLLASG